MNNAVEGLKMLLQIDRRFLNILIFLLTDMRFMDSRFEML